MNDVTDSEPIVAASATAIVSAPSPTVLTFRPLVFKENGIKYDWTGTYEISENLDIPVAIRNIVFGNVSTTFERQLSILGLVTTPASHKESLQKYIFKVTARLWLLTFVGEPSIDANNKHYTCDHIDIDHTNNRPSNLRWASLSDQAKNHKNTAKFATWITVITQPTLEPIPFGFKQFRESKQYFNNSGDNIVYMCGRWKKIQNIQPMRTGYIMVSTAVEMRRLLHRVVAHMFGDRNGVFLQDLDDTTLVIDHVDSNRTNNKNTNLQVVTLRQNNQATHDRGLGNAKAVIRYTVINGVKTEPTQFDSITSAAKDIGVVMSNVNRILNGTRKNVKGYTFRYAADVDSDAADNNSPSNKRQKK